jgi:hypothetical protein
VAAALAVALLALAIHYLPFAPFRVESASGIRRPISAAILAVVAGALAGNLLPFARRFQDGAKLIVRRAIPITIVLTGATLSFSHATSIGPARIRDLTRRDDGLDGRGASVWTRGGTLSKNQLADRRGNGDLRKQRHRRGRAADRRGGSRRDALGRVDQRTGAAVDVSRCLLPARR